MTFYVGRLAPSPTGVLHLGNIRTFLITWLHCRAQNGRLILRMEDLNMVRLKEGAIEQLLSDLRWLGFGWDNPVDARFTQSCCLDRYRKAFDDLRRAGRVYPCSCTRKDIKQALDAPHTGHELKYGNTCRNRWDDPAVVESACGRAPSWRFLIDELETTFRDGFYGLQRSSLTQWSGDFVIAQSIERIAYQLAVVVDDAHHGITQVIRGDDLLMSTHRQVALYDALNLQKPDFLHVPLVVGEDGNRLAKRHGDWKLSLLRAKGNSVTKILGFIAWTCGWAEWGEALSLCEIERRFTMTTVPKEVIVLGRDARDYFGI